uniref:Uncharacterized protein n=1 Tax=Myoviridae sp. ctBtT5 TaxID=2825048 RepID=A0A8S5PYS1_9CAUD|nr:MAG TPA: hypothetical protein [Myoviridae sp. ctBtT5]
MIGEFSSYKNYRNLKIIVYLYSLRCSNVIKWFPPSLYKRVKEIL